MYNLTVDSCPNTVSAYKLYFLSVTFFVWKIKKILLYRRHQAVGPNFSLFQISNDKVEKDVFI